MSELRHARSTDPQTSALAAESSTELLQTKTQLAIMAILEHGEATDIEIIRIYKDLVEFGDAPQASDSGIRSRRSELVRSGQVMDSGARRRTPAGRLSIVWKLV